MRVLQSFSLCRQHWCWQQQWCWQQLWQEFMLHWHLLPAALVCGYLIELLCMQA
jgi:hypothetical protein